MRHTTTWAGCSRADAVVMAARRPSDYPRKTWCGILRPPWASVSSVPAHRHSMEGQDSTGARAGALSRSARTLKPGGWSARRGSGLVDPAGRSTRKGAETSIVCAQGLVLRSIRRRRLRWGWAWHRRAAFRHQCGGVTAKPWLGPQTVMRSKGVRRRRARSSPRGHWAGEGNPSGGLRTDASVRRRRRHAGIINSELNIPKLRGHSRDTCGCGIVLKKPRGAAPAKATIWRYKPASVPPRLNCSTPPRDGGG